MRRAVPVVVATAGGLVLLSNFHTTTAALGSSVSGAPLATTPQQVTPSTARRGATSSTTASSAPPSTGRTIAGPVVQTDYGDVQVQITLDATGRLTDVQPLQLPSDRSRSRRISDAAGPILRSEALKAQSANIDLVSGASYTSEGYAQSLQGALDRAHR